MKIKIILTNGNVIELGPIKYLEKEEKELIREQIITILNNDGKFIHFSRDTFNEDLLINKQLIESVKIDGE